MHSCAKASVARPPSSAPTSRDTFAALEPVLRAGPVVLTHGNGPQVGNELLRQELAAKEAPQLPLYVAVAQTQAEVGALVASELPQIAERPVAVLLTRVRVAEDDPAFQNPTKPVGPFYDEKQAELLEKHRGWTLKEDAGRGWRRVVASPKPLEILELESDPRAHRHRRVGRARSAAAASRSSRRENRHDGIDAVIDKDLASALLATGLGAGEAPDRHAGGRRLPQLRHRRGGALRRRSARGRTTRCSTTSPPARCARRSRRRSRSCATRAARSRSRAPRRSPKAERARASFRKIVPS